MVSVGADGRPGIVAILGVKGGVGASVIAVGLASELTGIASPCVVDLDLYKGDIAGLLGLTVTDTLASILGMVSVMDPVALRGAAATHPSGLSIIGQPDALKDARSPDAPELGAFLTLARQAFDPVFIDCGSRVDPQTVQVCAEADVVVLVTTPELLSLRDLNRVSALLIDLGVPRDRLRVLVNKADRSPEVPLDEIGPLTGLPVAGVVRRDLTAARKATGSGQPVPDAAPGSRLCADLQGAWTALSGELLEPAAAARWWQRLFQRPSPALP